MPSTTHHPARERIVDASAARHPARSRVGDVDVVGVSGGPLTGASLPHPRSSAAATVGPVPGRSVVVIPCFDEAERLDPDRVLALTDQLDVLLVDDGSRDATLALMRSIAERSSRVNVLALGVHAGKAEAVR